MKPIAITLNDLTEFEKGYIIAALWTMDDDAPSGEYSTSGRLEELFPLIAQDALKQIIVDCNKFTNDREIQILLAQAGNDSQNGHDFFLTRNGHGCGFWDRGYDKEAEGSTLSVGDLLTEKCHAFGEADLYEGDDGKLYYQAP